MSKIQLITLDPVKEVVKQKLIEQYDSTKFINTTSVHVNLDLKDILNTYVEQLQVPDPVICITTDAYAKMQTLVNETDTEIGWYGTVEKIEGLNETYLIKDILVYPQTVTGATCEQDDDRIFEFEMELTTEQVNEKRFHGHSHVNMGVTPSGVDESFYQDLLTQINDYLIVLVINKKGDYTLRFYDVEHNLMYSDLQLNVILNSGEQVMLWYNNNIETKLKKPTPVQTALPITTTTTKTKKSKKTSNPYDDYDWDDYMYDMTEYGYPHYTDRRYL